MKILLVTHRYPPNTGGVEKHVFELATRLADQGHNVTVFSADAGAVSKSSNDQVRVCRFRSLSPDKSIYFAPGITPAIHQADADVVHAHNYHSLPVFLAGLGITDERFIVTPHYHGASANGLRNQLLSLYRPFGAWTLRQADEVIAVSRWEQEKLSTDFELNATVIPNGINVDQFAEAEPEQRDQPYLLCVGRLEEYKGIQHVIRALPELPSYELLVAGTGPYQSRLEGIARDTGVSDRVNLLGYVEEDRLANLYAGSKVYINLSRYEAYGITVAEALAAGTPCVVREKGALQDWTLKEECFGISNLSPEYVADKVHAASESSAHSKPVCDLTNTVEHTLEIYRSDIE